MKAIGWIIAAVGGYWLLEQMGVVPCVAFCPTASGTTTTGSAGQPTGTNTSTTTNTTAAGVATVSTINQVIAKMKAASDDPTQNHSVYQFNYYYQQVTGVAGPDPTSVLPGDASAGSRLIDINTWWAGMQKAGFSGLAGFGVITTRINPYNNPMGRPFGNYLQLNGLERSNIRIN